MQVKILSSNEMYQLFENNKNLEEDIQYLCRNNIFPRGNQELFFFCLFIKEEVVGVLKLKTKGCESLSAPGFYNWLSFLSIKEFYHGHGYSKILLNELFKFMKINKLDHLLSSGYTESGFNRLRKNLIELSEFNNIKFKDKDRIEF